MSLRQQAVKGAQWNAVGSFTAIGIQLAQLFILARILSASDFGLMAMIQFFMGLAKVFLDAGMNNIIIHKPSLNQKQLSSLYWLQVLCGVLLGLLFLAMGPWMAAFYGEPFLKEMAAWAALVFFISPFGRQFELLLQKQLAFRCLALTDIGASLTGMATAVGFAMGGQGALSLVFGFVTGQAVRTAVFLCYGWHSWRPSILISRQHLKGFWNFGLYQIGERCVSYLVSNADRLVIGYFLGSQMLGYYQIAWSLTIQPVTRLNPIIMRIAFPVLAKVQGYTDKLYEGYSLLLKALSFLNFPLLGGLAVIAPYIVSYCLGPSWESTVPLIQILCCAGILRSVACPMQSLALALGKVRLLFKWTLCFGLLQTAILIVGAYSGNLTGVVVAVLIHSFLNLHLSLFFIVKPLLEVDLSRLYTTLFPASAMLLSMLLGLLLLKPMLHELSATIAILVLVCTGGTIYGLVGLVFFRDSIGTLLNIARQKLKPT